MAVKTAKNGIIILTGGDSYLFASVGAKQIYAIVVVDAAGASGTLEDADTNVLFSHSATAAGTYWYDLCGCVSTGNGLVATGPDITFYVYVR
jgi:hypothetical protein